jgi:hypothetical protein
MTRRHNRLARAPMVDASVHHASFVVRRNFCRLPEKLKKR